MRHALLLRIGAVAAAGVLLVATEPAESAPSVLVTTTSLEAGSLPQTITAYGSVEAAPSARQAVMSALAAKVNEIYVRRGEEVAKGAPLIKLVPSPMVATSYAQAKSALRVALQLVARTRKMVRQHLATAQQLADAEKSESDARVVLTALTDQGAAGPNVIRAPFHALVTTISTSRGAIVPEGTALLDLARPERLVLRVGVVPAQTAAIRTGEKVTITPIGATNSVAGTVTLTGSIVESRSGLVPVEVSLPTQGFRPGEMAEAVITIGEARGYIVPHQAILVDDDGRPYVVQAVHQVARKVPVEVLDVDGDRDVVTGALDLAAPLVLDGAYQLEDGMRVRLAPSEAKSTK